MDLRNNFDVRIGYSGFSGSLGFWLISAPSQIMHLGFA
tara:strand:+ start:379 stop:492 length:114 start_codon:yes stop_codon:yes gene_type:complete